MPIDCNMESKEAIKVSEFHSLSENVGRFNLKNRVFLIPEMNRIGSHLIAGVFRGFGIDALVMDTYKGIDLGLEYTSGKECYPCQVTLGDILYFMRLEKEKLGDDYHPDNYVYFMPEANGPCRFGMYNKYQRIVLDSIPGLDKLKIASLATKDNYSLEGIIDDELVGDLRKALYFSVVISDILDRLLWRIRPYERQVGLADEFIENSMNDMASCFESHGVKKDFDTILKRLGEILEQGKSIIDPGIPPKPLIGIVGEIYVRCHSQSNQDLIKELERNGAEVVNASLTEWFAFITYKRMKEAWAKMRLNLHNFHMVNIYKEFKKYVNYKAELSYQIYRQRQVYGYAGSLIDLEKDHQISRLDRTIREDDLFSIEVGTEAFLSIAAIKGYASEGFNGVINVYPFTCMPSNITSAVINPIMNRLGIPYLDTPYDSSYQPGRETAIRTFMYQAEQHMKRHGRKKH